jgi:hypothetical protein
MSVRLGMDGGGDKIVRSKALEANRVGRIANSEMNHGKSGRVRQIQNCDVQQSVEDIDEWVDDNESATRLPFHL